MNLSSYPPLIKYFSKQGEYKNSDYNGASLPDYRNILTSRENEVLPNDWRRIICALLSTPVAWNGLQHTCAVAFGIDEGNILSHAGYLHGVAEQFAARIRYFLY